MVVARGTEGVVSDVVIIGGGLAGLAAARKLGARSHLVESEDRLGGLTRTDHVDGFLFDWTGHWLHLRTPRWKEEVERLLPGGLLTIARRAVIHAYGTFTPYPFQANLHGLPPDVIAECLTGFVQATLGPEGEALRSREPRSAAEFIRRHLGEGIARHFMDPYNGKLFAVPTTELSPEWGGRFVPRPKLADVIDGAVGRVREGLGYNATFVYPATGGIESLARALADELTGSVSLSAQVERIDTRRRLLRFADGRELSYSSLISTMPLRRLALSLDPCPPEVAEAARRLRAVSVTCVELGVRGAPRVPFHWAYLPEPQFPFYRVGSPSQVNPALAPEGHTSYSVEFSHLGPDPEAGQRIEQAIDGLETAGMLSRGDVVLARKRTIPTAYVLFDHAFEEARRIVIDHCEREGIVLAGRYGQWEYSGMEDALVAGETAAERVIGSAERIRATQ